MPVTLGLVMNLALLTAGERNGQVPVPLWLQGQPALLLSVKPEVQPLKVPVTRSKHERPHEEVQPESTGQGGPS